MGWLFGKRKEPRIPLPKAHEVDDSSLRFPNSYSKKIIEPKKIKEAVGFEKPLASLEMPMELEPVMEKTRMPLPLPRVGPVRQVKTEIQRFQQSFIERVAPVNAAVKIVTQDDLDDLRDDIAGVLAEGTSVSPQSINEYGWKMKLFIFE